MGHARAEKPTYRTRDELESWKLKDSIISFGRRLVKDFDVAASELAAVNDAVAEEIEEAVAFAEASPARERWITGATSTRRCWETI